MDIVLQLSRNRERQAIHAAFDLQIAALSLVQQNLLQHESAEKVDEIPAQHHQLDRALDAQVASQAGQVTWSYAPARIIGLKVGRADLVGDALDIFQQADGRGQPSFIRVEIGWSLSRSASLSRARARRSHRTATAHRARTDERLDRTRSAIAACRVRVADPVRACSHTVRRQNNFGSCARAAGHPRDLRLTMTVLPASRRRCAAASPARPAPTTRNGFGRRGGAAPEKPVPANSDAASAPLTKPCGPIAAP